MRQTSKQLKELTGTTDKAKYRVWWIPQIPMKSFKVEVDSLDKAKLLTEVLADYDLFQYENKVKPDYSNTGGIETFEGGEWCEVDEDDDYDE